MVLSGSFCRSRLYILSIKFNMAPKKVNQSPRRRVVRSSKKDGPDEVGDNRVPGSPSRASSFMNSLASRDRA